MDKKTKTELSKTIQICEAIIQGKTFHVTAAELRCIPGYLSVTTITAAKKQNLVLKRGAKPIGTMEWQIPTGGTAYGDLYLGARFKTRAKTKHVNA